MKWFRTLGLAAAASIAVSAPALAEDELSYSITIGGTSDYVFRGFSNSNRDPAVQGSFDLTYGIWYAGIWASNTDYPNFGGPCSVDGDFTDCGNIGEIGPGEVDYYVGVKPVWGPVTFDLAILYYTFPGQGGDSFDGNYFELKGGASISPVKDLTLTVNNYYAWEFQWESGEVYSIEGIASYALPAWGMFSPTISATVGSQWGYDERYIAFQNAWGDDEYQWWNAGLSLTVEKFTMDFRYWDTALSSTADAGCDFNSSNASSFQCGPTFVFSAKVVLP